MKVSTGSCRGRPMCRPVGVFWAGACPGGHIGPPLRGGGGVPNQRKIGAKTDLANGGSGSGPTAGCGHPALRVQRWWCQAKGQCGHRPLRPAGGREGGTPGSSCPTGAMQVVPSIRADVGIGPYGKPDQPPKPAGAQRSVRARSREGWAGIDARIIPKGGPPPRPPRQRLAKRKARKEQLVKFGLCPIPSKCSTAYRVRKSQQSPARAPAGAASTEQNGLGPHPAAREGAPRP